MTLDSLLLRQVNPSWIREGRITSQTRRDLIPKPIGVRRMAGEPILRLMQEATK